MKELKLLGAEEDFKDLKHALIDFNVKKKKKSVKKLNILKSINRKKVEVPSLAESVEHCRSYAEPKNKGPDPQSFYAGISIDTPRKLKDVLEYLCPVFRNQDTPEF